MLDRFVSIDPMYTPTSSGKEDNIFITNSYDATSNLETVGENCREVWERITVSDFAYARVGGGGVV